MLLYAKECIKARLCTSTTSSQVFVLMLYTQNSYTFLGESCCTFLSNWESGKPSGNLEKYRQNMQSTHRTFLDQNQTFETFILNDSFYRNHILVSI